MSGQYVIRIPAGAIDFSRFTTRPVWLWSQPTLPLNGYHGSFTQSKTDYGISLPFCHLTPQLQLVVVQKNASNKFDKRHTAKMQFTAPP